MKSLALLVVNEVLAVVPLVPVAELETSKGEAEVSAPIIPKAIAEALEVEPDIVTLIDIAPAEVCFAHQVLK
jgi:hypothetical protein